MKAYITKLGLLLLTLVNLYAIFSVHKLTLQIGVLQSNYREVKASQFEWNRVHAGRLDAFFNELLNVYNKRLAASPQVDPQPPSPNDLRTERFTDYYEHGWFQFDDRRPQP